mmetsp:Transcript_94552/g.304173  ORF Transcript_94552/g.304173 Transcript_94552/m.304173 type:complete len:493 (+) Transcript_94552:532-2010(+)
MLPAEPGAPVHGRLVGRGRQQGHRCRLQDGQGVPAASVPSVEDGVAALVVTVLGVRSDGQEVHAHIVEVVLCCPMQHRAVVLPFHVVPSDGLDLPHHPQVGFGNAPTSVARMRLAGKRRGQLPADQRGGQRRRPCNRRSRRRRRCGGVREQHPAAAVHEKAQRGERVVAEQRLILVGCGAPATQFPFVLVAAAAARRFRGAHPHSSTAAQCTDLSAVDRRFDGHAASSLELSRGLRGVHGKAELLNFVRVQVDVRRARVHEGVDHHEAVRRQRAGHLQGHVHAGLREAHGWHAVERGIPPPQPSAGAVHDEAQRRQCVVAQHRVVRGGAEAEGAVHIVLVGGGALDVAVTVLLILIAGVDADLHLEALEALDARPRAIGRGGDAVAGGRLEVGAAAGRREAQAVDDGVLQVALAGAGVDQRAHSRNPARLGRVHELNLYIGQAVQARAQVHVSVSIPGLRASLVAVAPQRGQPRSEAARPAGTPGGAAGFGE